MKMIKKECLLVCLSVKWMFGFGSAVTAQCTNNVYTYIS